jgi:hypothetical protein
MPATTLPKVAIVISSTRTPRVGPKVAEWVKSVIDRRSESGDAIYELVDVAEFKLPVFDEPILPAMVPAKGMFAATSLFYSKILSQAASEREMRPKLIRNLILTSATRKFHKGTLEEVEFPYGSVRRLHLRDAGIQLRYPCLDEKCS